MYKPTSKQQETFYFVSPMGHYYLDNSDSSLWPDKSMGEISLLDKMSKATMDVIMNPLYYLQITS